VPVGHGDGGDRSRVPGQPRLKDVHGQAGGRPGPGPQVSTAGESAQFVDPAEIPADAYVARLGLALARGQGLGLHQLMAATAAYTELRQGELFALTIDQVTPAESSPGPPGPCHSPAAARRPASLR
jgi:hypothetical protein